MDTRGLLNDKLLKNGCFQTYTSTHFIFVQNKLKFDFYSVGYQRYKKLTVQFILSDYLMVQCLFFIFSGNCRQSPSISSVDILYVHVLHQRTKHYCFFFIEQNNLQRMERLRQQRGMSCNGWKGYATSGRCPAMDGEATQLAGNVLQRMAVSCLSGYIKCNSVCLKMG